MALDSQEFQPKIEIPNINTHIEQSFVVSSGSFEAQALYMLGLAIHHNLSFEAVITKFEETIAGYTDEELKELLRSMGSHHGTNTRAKETAVLSVKINKSNIKAALMAQLPIQDSLNYIYEISKERYSKEKIDSTLRTIWEAQDPAKIKLDLKAVAACLGLYEVDDGLVWWQSLPEEDRQELVDRGKKLLDESGV